MTYVKIALLAGAILSIAFAFFAFDQRGFNRGVMQTELKYAEQRGKAQEANKKIARDVIRRTDKDLQKALEKWFRD